MADCRQDQSGLVHGGTSQQERRLSGLDAEYVHVDENRFSDWIVFAAEYSRYLKYYDSTTGKVFKDWQNFYAEDISAILGNFAVQNIESYRRAVRKRLDYLLNDDHASQEGLLKDHLSELFSAILTLSLALNDFFLRLPDNNAFKTVLRRFIQTRLGPAFRRLLTYHQGAHAENLYQNVSGVHWKMLNKELVDADAVVSNPSTFAIEWWDPANAVSGFEDITADTSIFFGTTVYDKISHAGNHYLFSSILDTYSESYARLISEAESSLLDTLEHDNTHKPHYALFLAFLKLFRIAQGKLNRITRRHLDFYYRDVLRLRPKSPLPDQVHVLAELASQVESGALAQGTLFKADKDSLGRDRCYALSQETTFGRAKVTSLMATYRADPADHRLEAALRTSGRLFYAPVINSADGLGEELQTPLKDWHPFLNASFGVDGQVTKLRMPAAEIGFAVSSHYFFLSEGKRNIRIRLGGDGFGSLPSDRLVCRLSHPDGWLEKELVAIRAATLPGGGAGTELEIELDGIDPPVTAPVPDVHGDGFDTAHPVLQFLLRNDGSPYGYDDLKNIEISTIQVKVQVGDQATGFHADGIKQLDLSSADGNLDASKPFMPWGARPAKDSPFYIGHPELFSKKNAAFNLHVSWSNRTSSVTNTDVKLKNAAFKDRVSSFNQPSPETKPDANLQFLQGGTWVDAAGADTGGEICSADKELTFAASVSVPDAALTQPAIGPRPYDASARAGFIRLVLDGDFGQSTYASAYIKWLLAESKADPPGNDPPEEPYVPLIDALYLAYSAASEVVDLTAATPESLASREIRFHHIGPFGAAEQAGPPAGTSKHLLVPQFRFPGGADHVGEWYIGLVPLEPRESVGLLVQVLEGSTLPTLAKPSEHVTWSYWAGDRWAPFEKRDVNDGTAQLIRSGIIRFSIPSDATLHAGIMPHGKIWLRAAVTAAVGAVCRILAVEAQVLHAVFEPDGNAPDAMDQPLSAGTISKLKQADARFKKFRQPFSSFGGRSRESNDGFDLRCSERLRHKGRAVTIWDYERLVLEAFPQLYRVKCLHHTRIEDHPDTTLAIHNENLPGYVTLITVPSLVGRNDTNPLKPYTHQSLLSEIKSFLAERVSGQLEGGLSASTPRVCVCNPLFEEVQLQFKLQLRSGYDSFAHYQQQLQNELTQFLSPWAYDQPAELRFGGRIAKSILVDFIDERPYVDFITDVVLKQKPQDLSATGDLQEAVATTSRSILVSAPASSHTIEPYSP